MRRLCLILCALALAGGCATTAPQAVQDAVRNQLEDFALLERELLPLIPPAATVDFTTLTGDTESTNARQLWGERVRAFMFRGAGLLAWSRGEPYDERAAFAKLFPEAAATATGDDR